MTAVAHLVRDDAPRATARIAFTVDEEIGKGTDHFDLDAFGADLAYTFDGSGLGRDRDGVVLGVPAQAHDQGRRRPPRHREGPARQRREAPRGRRRGAPARRRSRRRRRRSARATSIRCALPAGRRRRRSGSSRATTTTTGSRSTSRSSGGWRPRSSAASRARRSRSTSRSSTGTCERCSTGTPRSSRVAEEAIRRAGVEPVHTIIRGGTDGARLTEKGLPTPNLFTGGQHYHSLREWASLQDMAAAAATCVELVKLWGEQAKTG